MADDVTLTIGANADDAEKELAALGKQIKDFEKTLSTVGKVAGLAFASLTAELGFAVAAAADAEKASNALTNSLQNQGIYSDELAQAYKDQAKELQALTGVDDDAVIKGQAFLQTMIGQQKITKEMTTAAVNLGEAMGGDVEAGFEALGRAMAGNTRQLKQFGITIEEGLPAQERQAKILEQLEVRFGGLAEASNKGLGGMKGLKNAFGDLQQAIGEQFAPVVSEAIKLLTQLINWASESKVIIGFAASVIGLGIAFTGAITGIIGFHKAITAARAAMLALGLSTKALVAATGLGLLLIVAGEIYLNWATIWPRMQAIYQSFVSNITKLTSGISTLLAGVFSFSPSKIKEGLAELKNALAKGWEDAFKDLPEPKLPGIKQDTSRKALANKVANDLREEEKLKTEIITEEARLRQLKLEEASQAEIDTQTKIIANLKAQQEEKHAENIALLQAQHEELLLLREEQHAIDAEQKAIFEEEILAKNEEYQALDEEQQKKFRERNEVELRSQIKTKEQIKQDAAKRELQADIQRRNQFLEDERKHGKEFAYINQAMHSEIYRGSKQAFGELAQLQQSSNSTLKSIGKVAAIANITIRTAEAAMNVFTGFSTIPIVGPALGMAAAIAVVAFGAEQIGKVNAAQKGGIVEGGLPGMDSVPFLLEPGELVVPRRNFSEVVNAVANQRLRAGEGEVPRDFGVPGDTNVMVTIALDGEEAERMLTARQVEARALGTIRERS